MIKKPTLFILGAGANMPYGFPSGQKLITDLQKGFTDTEYCKNNFGINQNLLKLFVENNIFDSITFNNFLNTLRNSGRISIDKFLRDQENGWDDFGKRLIGFIISLYETNCNPFEGAKNGKSMDFSESLYHYLFDKMDANVSENFNENQVKFITFNYDRCLEHFLQKAVTTNYPTNAENISEFLKEDIIHVHGSIGQISNEVDIVRNKLQYGAIYNSSQNSFLINLNHYGLMGENIRIVSENVIHEVQESCLKFFDWAEKIIFLGFGFDQQNLINIGMSPDFRKFFTGKEIYGTTLGMHKRERELLFHYFQHQLKIENINFDKLGVRKSVEYLRDVVYLN